MSFTETLCSEIKKYDEVIVYGYKDIGVCVLDYIIDLETSIKIANYSGRIKYFATSNKERTSMRTEVKGIKIKCIYELKDYAKNALIIVATQEKHHKSILTVLKELHFEHVLTVRHEDYCCLREVVENHKGIVNTQIGQYQLNHQIKLDRLRAKVKSGRKVKVFFMVYDSAIFGVASVYREMERDDLFEPYIYVVSRYDVTHDDYFEEVQKNVAFFKGHGYQTICGYDEDENPRDIHDFSPDIVFYDIPKLYGPAGGFYNRYDRINWEYLTCYVPYGMMMMDSFYYHYHTRCIRETWKFFIDTKVDFKRVMADGDFCGFNIVLSGYPKFDDYCERRGKGLPDKISNGNPIVIYAPHHSFGVSHNLATFDLYGYKILELAKKNPQINFVFKPHPLVPLQIKTRYRQGIINISPEDYKNYLREWKELPNAVCVDEGDYIELFKRSSCMITDCGSFVGEYFPSQHPCIYIFNPRKKQQDDAYAPLAKKILDTYYVTRTEQELDAAIETIILKGIDEKKEKRKKLLKSEFGELGHAGEKICGHLREMIL